MCSTPSYVGHFLRVPGGGGGIMTFQLCACMPVFNYVAVCREGRLPVGLQCVAFLSRSQAIRGYDLDTAT